MGNYFTGQTAPVVPNETKTNINTNTDPQIEDIYLTASHTKLTKTEFNEITGKDFVCYKYPSPCSYCKQIVHVTNTSLNDNHNQYCSQCEDWFVPEHKIDNIHYVIKFD